MLMPCFVAMNATIASKQSKNNMTSAKMQNYSVEISVEKLMGNFDERAREWKLTDCLSK